MAPHLAPFNPPLGPQPNNAHFYSPNAVTLAMKESVFSLSGDDFAVKTTDGLEVCKCKGRVVSIRDKKKFTDVRMKIRTIPCNPEDRPTLDNGRGMQ